VNAMIEPTTATVAKEKSAHLSRPPVPSMSMCE